MFSEITSKENFDEAFRKTQLGAPKYKPDAIRFTENQTVNLARLRQLVISGEYQPGEYLEFSVFEPKERVIYAPRYKDKIVQHAANNVLRDFYEPKFIFDSYAWIIKADVQRFFYSINRDVILAIVRRKITCPETLALLERIILSSPGDLGLPLGNLTSQLLANVLMNELDHYIKRTLGVRLYVRYADDLVLIVDGKAQAQDVLGCIRAFGRDVLDLHFPDRKCFIRPLHLGLETLGYRITPAAILLTSAAKSRFIKRLKALEGLLASKRITPAEALRSLTSWYSYAGTAACQRFVRDACLRTERIRFADNERFIILG